MKSVSVIIAAYNEENNITNCLESIFKLDYDKAFLEVIVVDNNSTDRTIELAQQFPVRVLQEFKIGPSHARNKGITEAKNEIIVFIDADVIVPQNWLKNLIIPFSDSKVGAVGGKILPLKENWITGFLGHSILGKYPRSNYKRYEKSYITCNLAIRKELLEKGFDTDLKKYTEDLDITMRIVDQGFKIQYEPTASLYHKHPDTIIQLFQYWVNSVKGRIYFCNKYPAQKTCILMKYQVPILYLLFLIFLTFLFGKWTLLLLLPVVLYLYKLAIIEYKSDKRFILNFIIVPILNVTNIFCASLMHGYYKHIRKIG